MILKVVKVSRLYGNYVRPVVEPSTWGGMLCDGRCIGEKTGLWDCFLRIAKPSLYILTLGLMTVFLKDLCRACVEQYLHNVVICQEDQLGKP